MAEWYYKIAEQVVGPLSADQLRALAEGGRLAPGDPVAKSSGGPWVPASRVKGLFEVAAVDDEPEEDTAGQPTPPEPGTSRPPELPTAAPPIPQPPVVTSERGVQDGGASPRGDAAEAGSVPTGGFAIQTEEVGAGQRRKKKKRTKKPREPLTKKQKNARLVKWLAVAIVAGIVVFASIPYLRKLAQPAPEAVAENKPVAADVDLGAGGMLDVNLDTSASVEPGPSATARAATSTAKGTDEPAPSGNPDTTDLVEVKAIRYVLDRPQMTNTAGNAGRTADRFLLVELELTARNSDTLPRFRGWASQARDISLTDDQGVEYKVRTPDNFSGMYVDGQCRETKFLSADEPTTDVIVFAWPEDKAPELPSTSEDFLKLRLPKSVYGEQGELKIAIPLSEIDVTSEGMRKSRGKQRAGEGGTSDNVRMDGDGPIPIPGLTD